MSFSLLLRHKWLTCFSIVRLPRFWHQVQFYKSSTFSQILCRPEDPTLHIPFPLYTFSFFTMLTSPHTHEKKKHFCGPCGEYCALLLRLTSATGRMAATLVCSSVPMGSRRISQSPRQVFTLAEPGESVSEATFSRPRTANRPLRVHVVHSCITRRSRAGVESGGVPWALLGWRFSIYNFPTRNRPPCFSYPPRRLFGPWCSVHQKRLRCCQRYSVNSSHGRRSSTWPLRRPAEGPRRLPRRGANRLVSLSHEMPWHIR